MTDVYWNTNPVIRRYNYVRPRVYEKRRTTRRLTEDRVYFLTFDIIRINVHLSESFIYRVRQRTGYDEDVSGVINVWIGARITIAQMNSMEISTVQS